jgi:hypothetical protein
MISLAMLLLSLAHVEMKQHEIETGLPEKRRSARQRALKRMNANPFPVNVPHYTRDELHERG